jgi:hypothetical protein
VRSTLTRTRCSLVLRDASPRTFMIETIVAILFVLGIVLVMTGPKPSDKKGSDKKGKDSGASSSPTPKAPDSPEK